MESFFSILSVDPAVAMLRNFFKGEGARSNSMIFGTPENVPILLSIVAWFEPSIEVHGDPRPADTLL